MQTQAMEFSLNTHYITAALSNTPNSGYWIHGKEINNKEYYFISAIQ
jgi:hypothetical protein